MNKLAIFDLDGTLLNTLDDLAAACNHALREQGLPEHPAQAYKQFVGNGIDLLIYRALPARHREDNALHIAVKAAFSTYYGEHGEELTRPYEGVTEMLDRLRKKGVALAVLSNKPHRFTSVLVPRYFGDRFTLAYGQRDGFPSKPDGALVMEIMQTAGFLKEQTVYLGDSGVDMQTAKNGGVHAVGALWGFRDRAELEQAGADACISHPSAFLQFFA